MHPMSFARARALSLPPRLPSLRLALALIVAMAMVTLTMVAGALPSNASGPTVVITDTLSPKSLSIAPGTTVTWVNRDDENHRLRAEDGGIEFDSKDLEPGDSWSYTFSTAGTASYHDHEADDDTAFDGKVIVGQPAGDTSAGAPAGAPVKPAQPASPSAASSAAGVKAASHRVAISDSGFTPAVLNARVGDKVTWTNSGQDPHTVTGGPWDAPLDPGQSFTTVLRAAGTVAYVCTYHSNMKGTVKIAAAPAGTKLPPPSAAQNGSGAQAPSAGAQAPAADAPAPVTAPGAQRHTVTISGNAYSPDPLVARVGDSVTWINKDPMPHTVTGGPWDAMIKPGGKFSAVLTEPGTVKYVCTLHPGMGGSVQVKPALPGTKVSAATPAAPAAPPAAPGAHGKHVTKPAPVADATAEKHLVTIKDFKYSPETLQAKVGDTVTFVNKDSAPHTATANDKSFDSGMLKQGGEFTVKLTKEGTFDYLCTYHPNMVGKIVVKAADAAATTSAEPAHSAPEMALTAGNVAGIGSGWVGLFLFLAGTQLRTRLRGRR